MVCLDALIPDLAAALGAGRNVLLCAPPGTGKTTRVPLGLLGEPWLAGRKILLLEPRRLAARAAARYMASLLGEPLGETVGYRVRLDSQVSPRTRVEVVTEGILTRQLQQDPELTGVGLVIFDEFHERSLQADLGLALCLDIQGGLRADLPLLIMSATLEAAPLAPLLGDALSLVGEGRAHPVHTLHAPPPAGLTVAETAVWGVLKALEEQPGDVLAFLPGAPEIRAAARRLEERLGGRGILVCPLYGDLDGPAQDRAIQPDPQGRRRVVLATSIAETSLTIEGVSTVVDAGWSRQPRFDPNTGLGRLVTQRLSHGAADQRRGRAGRLGPGVCYRLWPASLPLAPRAGAEILRGDLASLVLELALWGVTDPHALAWLDPPPAAALGQARDLLTRLEALDPQGRVTPLGRRMAALPLHPRLAHMLLRARERGAGALAADLAALLSERDPFRSGPGEAPSRDLAPRLEALAHWRAQGRGGRAQDLAWPLDPAAARRLDRVSRQLRAPGEAPSRDLAPPLDQAGLSLGALVALAYPDRVAARRPGAQGGYRLVNGRGARLPEGDPLGNADHLAVAALDAGERDGRVFLAAALAREDLLELFGERLETRERVYWDRATRSVQARRETRLGALTLAAAPLPDPPREAARAALLGGLRQEGLDGLPWDRAARALQARILCLAEWDPGGGWPDLSDAGLLAGLEHWLAPWLDGITSAAGLARLDLTALLTQTLGWDKQRALETLAPTHLAVPSGSRRPLRYEPGQAPVLAVRLQEMFGQGDTPRICAGRVAVTLHLLSPAGRPVQITQDLAGFWARTYAEVRKELKGRYPKHYWPEDPRAAVPTARVRPA